MGRGMLGRILVASMLVALAWGSCAAAPAASAKKEPTFTLKHLVLDGNTILSDRQINRFAGKYLGQDITAITGAKEVATALQKVYFDRGYVTVVVTVPRQTIADGMLRLEVHEGKVGEVTVTGNGYFTDKNIARYFPKMGDRLNKIKIDRALVVSNRHPDKQVNAVIKPGEGPGTSDLELKVQDQWPLHFRIGLDNTGTKNTKELRLLGALQYNNLFWRDHMGSVQVVSSPEDFEKVWTLAGSYVIPVTKTGQTLSLYAGHSESETETILELVEFEGEGTVFGAQYTVPLPECWGIEQSVSVGAQYQRIENSLIFGQTSIDDTVSLLPVSFRWDGTRRDESGRTSLTVGLTHHWRGSAGKESCRSDFNRVRFGADADYTIWNLALRRVHKLPKGWTLLATAAAQLTDDKLLPAEEFGAGGAATVRGYETREVQGDRGFNLKLEARTPPLPKVLPKRVKERDVQEETQLVIFYDYGRIIVKDALPGEEDDYAISGMGMGIRISLFKSIEAVLDAAFALDEAVHTDSGDVKAHFMVQYTF